MPRRASVLFPACATLVSLAFWLGSGSTFVSRAAVPDYFIRKWQTEDGLPENKVMAVLQTRDGYVWVGTYSGLARFDGIRFTTFDNGNTPELHSPQVTSLFESGDGALWIGHANGELTRYLDGRFEAVPVHAVWNGGKLMSIGSDTEGDIWLLNQDGLLARVRDGLVLTPESGTETNLVAMTRNAAGTIWVAREGRVSELKHGGLKRLDFGGQSAGMYVQGIGASRDGGLWVMSDGLMRKWSGEKWTDELGPSPWGLAAVLSLIETREGRLVAATSDSGLYLVSREGERSRFCRTNGFPLDWITGSCQDREGNLWLATGGGGLVVLRKGNLQTLEPPDRWQGRPVLSVLTAADGALWVGTEGAGLYRFGGGQWQNFAGPDGLRNAYIWSIAQDSKGTLWAGTWSGGLFARQGERFDRAPGLEGLLTPMPALLAARTGGLWIGAGAGLLRYDAGHGAWSGEGEDRGMRDVCALAEAEDGTVWFGTSGSGLGRWKDGAVRRYRRADGLSSDFVQCLYLDSAGALWIGTFGGGLCRFKDGRFNTIGTREGLANIVICDIEEDGEGFFWMSSHGGLMRVSKQQLDACANGQLSQVHCLTYGLSDGMPTLQCSGGLQPAGCKTADGRLWFATTKGLVTVDPKKVESNPWPPPVVIEELLVDDHAVSGAAWGGEGLRILPGRNRFEFRYAGLSFVAPDKVRFRHKLDGLDTEWVEAGAKRIAYYSYIPPGHYTFHVTACNNDEVWNERGAELSFIMLPHFWQTWWFKALLGLLVVTGASGAVWFDTRRRMRRKLERLERQRAVEHERARIAQDIHDDLGASLTRITMLSQSARGELDQPAQAAANLDDIYGTARELTRAMDEIVWAVNPRHDTLESLVNYLEKQAQDFLGAAGIRCRLDLPERFPAWNLTTEVRHNLFLAFKEALNNVAKHAAASEVRISLVLEAATFRLAIEDNGRGFEVSAKTAPAGDGPDRFASGNGLGNMRRRLEEIGGRFDLESAPGKGTRIVFAVPVKVPAS